jgi:hypothetical protein
MNRKESFLCLDRQNASWRMDGITFSRFMKHVSGYFGICGTIPDVLLDDILYAEIAGDDLNVVSAIFGGYSPDDDQIVMVPVHPETFILPSRNTFHLMVCEKSLLGDVKRCIRLKSR